MQPSVPRHQRCISPPVPNQRQTSRAAAASRGAFAAQHGRQRAELAGAACRGRAVHPGRALLAATQRAELDLGVRTSDLATSSLPPRSLACLHGAWNRASLQLPSLPPTCSFDGPEEQLRELLVALHDEEHELQASSSSAGPSVQLSPRALDLVGPGGLLPSVYRALKVPTSQWPSLLYLPSCYLVRRVALHAPCSCTGAFAHGAHPLPPLHTPCLRGTTRSMTRNS